MPSLSKKVFSKAGLLALFAEESIDITDGNVFSVMDYRTLIKACHTSWSEFTLLLFRVLLQVGMVS